MEKLCLAETGWQALMASTVLIMARMLARRMSAGAVNMFKSPLNVVS
jgi:hypothetical protein